MTNEINEENIRVAAYYIWEQAGRPEGQEKECWIKACEQLFAAGSKSQKACKTSCKTSCKTESNPVQKAEKQLKKQPKAKISVK